MSAKAIKTSGERTLDLSIRNEGSIILFSPMSPAAHDWLHEHCPEDPDHQYFCGALVVEPRYASDLVRLARQDGLCV